MKNIEIASSRLWWTSSTSFIAMTEGISNIEQGTQNDKVQENHQRIGDGAHPTWSDIILVQRTSMRGRGIVSSFGSGGGRGGCGQGGCAWA